MNVVDSARAQVKQIVGKVTEKVGELATSESRVQAITIARPRNEVVESFQDPGFLSEVFGDIATVSSEGSDRLKWAFGADGSGPSWDCVVAVDDDSHLRFVDVNPEKEAGVSLDFRDAPQGRGTEVIARVASPAPGALSGVATFKALYRARALLMTGEVPTIKYNPSARDSDR